MSMPVYAVSFVFCRTNIRLDFMFAAFKNADELYRRIAPLCGDTGRIDVEDDFECRSHICMSEVSAVIFNSLEVERKNQVSMRIEGDKLYSKAVMAEQGKPNIHMAANALKV